LSYTGPKILPKRLVAFYLCLLVSRFFWCVSETWIQ